jgi:hypothetical protein
VVEPLTIGGTKDVQKPSERDGSVKKGGLFSCENERKVCLEGKHNPLDGAVEESLQDNSLAYYSSKEGENINWIKMFF